MIAIKRVAILLSLLACFLSKSEADSHEKGHKSGIKHLRDHLFANYDRNVRPVHNASDTTTVKISVNPFYIIDMSDDRRILTMTADILLKWHDEYLAWDPHQHEGITNLRVEMSDIWLPDVNFWSTLPVKDGWIGSGIDPQNKLPNLLLFNGTVTRWEKHTFSFLCDPVKEDPEIRRCSFMMGAWASDGSHIDFEATDVTTGYLIPNPKWKLDGHDSKTAVFTYGPHTFPHVITTLDIKKQEETDDKSEDR